MGFSVGRLFRSNSLTPMEPTSQTKSRRFDLFQRLHAVLQEAFVIEKKAASRGAEVLEVVFVSHKNFQTKLLLISFTYDF
jgi:hypothetical protein